MHPNNTAVFPPFITYILSINSDKLQLIPLTYRSVRTTAAKSEISTYWSCCAQHAIAGSMNRALAFKWANWYHSPPITHSSARIARPPASNRSAKHRLPFHRCASPLLRTCSRPPTKKAKPNICLTKTRRSYRSLSNIGKQWLQCRAV